MDLDPLQLLCDITRFHRALAAMSLKLGHARLNSKTAKEGVPGALFDGVLSALPGLKVADMRLDLGGSLIGVAGAGKLGAVVEKVAGLRCLDLSENGLGSEGAALAGAGLGKCTALTDLVCLPERESVCVSL